MNSAHKFLVPLCFFIGLFSTVWGKVGCVIERCPLPEISKIRYSGFFGELRNAHFHSGVDIKTNKKTGLKIEAFEKGYVYRVSITLSGYGKALYIKHPNGFVSVYAHLEKFSTLIESYVKAKQYEKESYTINLYPEKKIHVKKGEVIGYSGNSGRSFGPHLHFELRDEKQNPVNPFLYGLEVKDHTPPELKSVYMSFLNKDKAYRDLKLTFKPVGKNILKAPVQKVSGHIGFKIETFDRHDLSYNKNGTFKIETFLNETKYVSIVSDKLKFQESKLINDHIDYEQLILQKQSLQKLYIDHVKINTFKYVDGDGTVYIKAGKDYTFKIILSDVSGNKKTLLIPISGRDTNHKEKTPDVCAPQNAFTIPAKGRILEKGKFKITFPKNSFFEASQPICIKTLKHKILLSPSTVPLKEHIIISYSTKDPKELKLLDKYAFAEYKKIDTVFIKTQRQNTHTIKANISKMGNYLITKDIEPPQIKPKYYTPVWWTFGIPTIQIFLTDQDSGIKTYRATINGQWILMEYDVKTSSLTYYHNNHNLLRKEEDYELKIFAQDWAGNSAEYRTPLYDFN